MSAQPKRRRSAEELTQERREQIYQAALKVFAEHGYRDAGIAQVAKEMGVGHGTIYRYFENKQAIVEYVIQRTMLTLAPVIAADPPNATTTLAEYRDQVGRIGHRLYDTFIANSELATVLFIVSGEVEAELRDKVREIFEFFTTATEQYLENGVSRGFLDPDLDTYATAALLNSMIFTGAQRLSMVSDPEAEAERWIAAAQKLIFEGVGRPRAAE